MERYICNCSGKKIKLSVATSFFFYYIAPETSDIDAVPALDELLYVYMFGNHLIPLAANIH